MEAKSIKKENNILSDNPKEKRKKKVKLSKVLLVSIAIVLCCLFLFPLIWMVLMSFKTLGEAMGGSNLIPKIWTLENYFSIFSDTKGSPIIQWLINTAIVTAIGTLLVLAVDILAAYALARLNVPMKKVFMAIIVFAMAIPGIVTLFPAFYMFKLANLLNSYIPLIIPYAANVMGVYLIYNFLIAFPKELEEAALIDGANIRQILLKVILPSIKPVVLTLGVVTFLGIYNDYLWPSLVVSQNEMRTITTGIASLIQGANFVNPAKMMASTVVAIIPGVTIFLFVNKYIVKGTNNSGIK